MLVFEPKTQLLVELPAPPSGSKISQNYERAKAAMRKQLTGAPVNLSEARAVGHHWLRAPERAPSPQIQAQIEASQAQIMALAPQADKRVLLLGIGGSALGVQLLSQALVNDPARLVSIDNADPQAIAQTLARVDTKNTIPVVVTKSGNTAETNTAWQAAREHWRAQGQDWDRAAFAVTGPSSPLAAVAKHWRGCLDIWPWVGGRFCVSSAAGLLPLRLLGADVQGFLQGAAWMDERTSPDAPDQENLALALAHLLFEQQANTLHSLAILAYRDRLRLLGRYLQQLVMESLGKAQDLQGSPVQQGLSVYGERGSTDQHSILQYLSQGRSDTLSMLVESRSDEPAWTEQSDAHLSRVLGTYQALHRVERPPILLSLARLDAPSLGAVIALFERCIGYYAGMANLNAYDQPGVQAGKLASADLLTAKAAMLDALQADWQSCAQLAKRQALSIPVAWRLAMAWVSQGKAEHRPGEVVPEHQFRASR